MVERSLRRHFDFPFEATPPAKFVPARAPIPLRKLCEKILTLDMMNEVAKDTFRWRINTWNSMSVCNVRTTGSVKSNLGLQIRYHRITKTTSMLSSSTAITSRTGSKTTLQSKVECQI